MPEEIDRCTNKPLLGFLTAWRCYARCGSGTRTVKLSTGRKTKKPNAVRTVHKAEAIRLYHGACEMEGYTQENGRPSERTLWNILNNCPASQRKSLAGLDNVVSDGSDSFDRLIKICKTLEDKSSDDLVKELTEGRRYLKGNYRAHCSINGCKGIADHCIKYALSDEKESSYKSTCGEKHDKACFECDSPSQASMSVKNLITNAQDITENEKNNFHYDATQSVNSILQLKAHVLTTVNQDIAKYLILEQLNDSTAFIIIDFAMKFLARRYRESMRSWFGKVGNGMHVSCVIMKDNSDPDQTEQPSEAH